MAEQEGRDPFSVASQDDHVEDNGSDATGNANDVARDVHGRRAFVVIDFVHK
jgi:hypothetical protein